MSSHDDFSLAASAIIAGCYAGYPSPRWFGVDDAVPEDFAGDRLDFFHDTVQAMVDKGWVKQKAYQLSPYMVKLAAGGEVLERLGLLPAPFAREKTALGRKVLDVASKGALLEAGRLLAEKLYGLLG